MSDSILNENNQINGWVYQLEITQTTFDDIEEAIKLSDKSYDKILNEEEDVEMEVMVEDVAETIKDSADLIFNKDSYYRIEDPDSWTNLREGIDGSVIRKVYQDEQFIILKIEDDWCEVFFEDFTSGFIHKSRVRVVK